MSDAPPSQAAAADDEGPCRLLSLPQPLLEQCIELTEQGSRKSLFASCKMLAGLVLALSRSRGISRSREKPSYQLPVLEAEHDHSSMVQLLHWAAACAAGRLWLRLRRDDTPLYLLCQAAPGGCLPWITRLSIFGVDELAGLLPARLLAALPSLTHLAYSTCTLRSQRPLEPVCTQLDSAHGPATVKLQHLELLVDPCQHSAAHHFSPSEQQHIQQLYQISTLTSLELYCVQGMLPDPASSLPQQLTALTLCLTGDMADNLELAAAARQAATSLLRHCTALKDLVADGMELDVPALLRVQSRSPFAQLTSLELPDTTLANSEAVALLALPYLSRLTTECLELQQPYEAATSVRELGVAVLNLQQLSCLPLQQLTQPLVVNCLELVTTASVARQVAWAEAAAARLRAGPGSTQLAAGCYDEIDQFHLCAGAGEFVSARDAVQLITACTPFAPRLARSEWNLMCDGMAINAAVVRALQRMCPDAANLRFGVDCRFHPSWPAALAECWPHLRQLRFDGDVNWFAVCLYCSACQQQVAAGQPHHSPRTISFGREEHSCWWCGHRVAQLQDHLRACGIHCITLETLGVCDHAFFGPEGGAHIASDEEEEEEEEGDGAATDSSVSVGE